MLRTCCYSLTHLVVKRVLIYVHRAILSAPGEAIAHRFHVEPAMFQLYLTLSCMLHTENSYSSRHRHINARRQTTPYALVLRDDVLEDRDLVVADGVAVIIKDHKASVRCVGFYVLHRACRNKKDLWTPLPALNPASFL